MSNLILICLLSAIVVETMLAIVIVIVHHFERKDLYTRLMSRDLSDYKNAENTKPPKAPKSAHKTTLEKWRKVSDEA